MERRYYNARANISSPIQTLLSVREFHPVGAFFESVSGLSPPVRNFTVPKDIKYLFFEKIGCTGVHPIFYKSNY